MLKEIKKVNKMDVITDEKLKCEKDGCFACIDGVCQCLADVNFGDRDCPFYTERENSESYYEKDKERAVFHYIERKKIEENNDEVTE